MTVHWGNYDPNKSGQDYKNPIEDSKSHQLCAKPLKSSFFVKTSLTTSKMTESIQQHLDVNDAVVVVDFTNDNWTSYNVPRDVAGWMMINI